MHVPTTQEVSLKQWNMHKHLHIHITAVDGQPCWTTCRRVIERHGIVLQPHSIVDAVLHIDFCEPLHGQGSPFLLGIYNIVASPVQHIAPMCSSCVILVWHMLPT